MAEAQSKSRRLARTPFAPRRIVAGANQLAAGPTIAFPQANGNAIPSNLPEGQATDHQEEHNRPARTIGSQGAIKPWLADDNRLNPWFGPSQDHSFRDRRVILLRRAAALGNVKPCAAGAALFHVIGFFRGRFQCGFGIDPPESLVRILDGVLDLVPGRAQGAATWRAHQAFRR